MDAQSIRFTEVDGRRVAWATSGEGPPLVMGGWWMSHLELNWRDPGFRSFAEALGRHRTLIRYDSPGLGLSDREGPPLATLEEELAVLRAVVEAAGVEAIELYGASAGGPIALAYAAEQPRRVRRVVLYGAYASGSQIAPPQARESIVALVRRHWGLGSRVLTDLFMPTAPAAEREAFVAFQRESGGAETAARSLQAVYGFDVAGRLPEVRAPSFVLHRRADRAIPFEAGRELAAALPDAAFVALEGGDHFPWLGDSGEVLRALLAALDVEPDPGAAQAPGGAAPEPPAEEEVELSPREIEVLRLVAAGLSDREIADRLVLSPHTVHRHVANIRAKLRLPSRAAAAAQAARLELL